jgi:syntaxin 16
MSVAFPCARQVKRNVQRTLAIELQKLSVQFRKQQKQHLNRLRQKDGGSTGGFPGFDDAGPSGSRPEEDFDAGFSEAQVSGGDISAVRGDRLRML